MKVSFEFDGATPKQVAAVLEKFYSEYDGKTVKDNGAEVEKTMIGKINIYISLKGAESGTFYTYSDTKTNKEIQWHIKKPAKDPKKARKNQIYDDQELGYVICE